MEAEDPLANLADIHLPGPVSFWPPAPGWWVLALVVIILLVLTGIWYARRWQRMRRLDSALQELDKVYATYNNSQQSLSPNEAGLEYLYGCNEVLKRVALNHYPHIEVANLNGTAWLRFLDRTGATNAFSAGQGKVLGDGIYRPVFTANPAVVYELCSRWIKRHYKDAPKPVPELAIKAGPTA